MYSILLPYYDPEFKKSQTFTECIRSVVENTRVPYELIIQKDGPSYVESHNRALKAAHGDYLIVLNDDIIIQDPEWIEKLTGEGICSWRLGKFHLDTDIELPDAACFGMSRETFLKLGLMDEVYKDGVNYEDTDYFLRAYKMQIPFKNGNVTLAHKGYQTITLYSSDDEANPKKELNRKLFLERWR